MDKYAVFGNPIAHSKSPQIHTLFAQQTGQALVYTSQCVAAGEFALTADRFFGSGGRGLNITVPFKPDAYDYASGLTSRARCAGAVNTLALRDDGTLLGDNTDGAGLVSDIVDNLTWGIRGKTILLLGAGGAVRGCLQPLLERRPHRIVIANRTAAKALRLAREFKDLGEIQACGFEDLADLRGFDLVINGTSASLGGDLPALPAGLLKAGSQCYDMMYGAGPTVFMQWARSRGCLDIADGLGMLVAQAAESFFLWRGIRPSTKGVVERLRGQM